MKPEEFDAEVIESFAGMFLSPRYDNPQPVAPFHREAWRLYCSSHELCAVAAPREHAKSTALTHAYVLAVLLFRVQSYAIIVSATEDLAKDHLADIADEFRENEDLRREFLVAEMLVDAKTEIIVRFTDGHQCRVLAKGSGQKMRGLKWRGQRPGLIIGDDLEEDEQVESRDRRLKFGRWVRRALLPCRRRGGLVRIHGTILHEDSYLAQLMRPGSANQWKHLLYKAHKGFDDFSQILWPQQWPEARLRARRDEFVSQGDGPGYSQEYLNDPLDHSEAYLQREWFLPMAQADRRSDKRIAVGCDFAISKKDAANRTSFTVGGTDAENLLHIIDQHVGRWDSLEIVEKFFEIDDEHNPDFFFVEKGQIWSALQPLLLKEMQRRGQWLNIIPLASITDKAARGRGLQKRMRSQGMRFDKEASWYPAYEDELIRFTGTSEARLDDQFDSTTILVRGMEDLPDVEEEEFIDEDEWLARRHKPQSYNRNPVTGY